MHRQKAEVFLSWITFVSYLSVLQNVYPEQLNPPTSYRAFLLCPTLGCADSRFNHWSGIQVARARFQDARATAVRTSLKAGVDSMQANNWEHFTKIVAASYKRKIENIYCWISSRGGVSLPILRRNHHKKNYISCKNLCFIKPVFYRLENSRFHFQKCLCNWGWSRD